MNTPETQAAFEGHERQKPESSSPRRERAQQMAHSAAETTQEYAQRYAQHYVSEPAKDLLTLAKEYAQQHPDVAALWCFGLGVFVGWKIKP